MVSHHQIKCVAPEALKLNILPTETQEAFADVAAFEFLDSPSWYLAGGTALALQVGHRKSFDLDFFTTQNDFPIDDVERFLENTGRWTTTLRSGGKTLYGEYRKTKISLIAYPSFVPSGKRLQCGSIKILYPFDISAMKVVAISQRGRKRDFVDLYWHATKLEPLPNVIKRTLKQYPQKQHNIPHILKSLVYFDDADKDPMPEILFNADWKTMKAYFRHEVPKAAKEFFL